jgi:predicted GNAT family acetyltransferase
VLGHTSSFGNGAGGRKVDGTMDMTVVDVPEKGRFEIRDGDRVVGLASYHVDDGVMTLPHTEIDPSVGGRGLGTALVAGVLSAARERGLHVLPYCSFVRHYIQQHPETVDLVAEDDRPHFGLATADR